MDVADGKGVPKTMASYSMQGTPTLLVFDRQGRLRRHYFGQVEDMRLAAEIMGLAIDEAEAPREATVAIERKLHATLVDANAHHGNDHHHAHGEDCGCDHEHHDYTNDHAPDQGGDAAITRPRKTK